MNAAAGSLTNHPSHDGVTVTVTDEIYDELMAMATEPLDAKLIEELLPANYCVEDANYVLDYYRRTADNRLG